MAYENEAVMRAIQTLLEDELTDALDVVEASWQAVDPVALPDPVAYHPGYKLTILELPSTSFPFVSILAPNRSPFESQAGRLGQEDVRIEAALHVFVIADDEATVTKLAHRYAEALVNVFQANQVIAAHAQRHWEPAVRVGVTERHAKGGTSGDLFDPESTDFIRIVEIQLDLVGG